MALHGVLLSHQLSAERQMSVISGNFGLTQLPGGQEHKVLFSSYLDGEKKTYPQEQGTVRNLANGDLTPTKNPLDIGIIGPGYFKIMTPDGLRYGRNGRFRLNAEGEFVVGRDGRLLMEDGSPLTLPQGAGIADVQIASDMSVTILGEYVGKVGIDRFEKSSDLKYLKHAHLYEKNEGVEALSPFDEEGVLLVQVEQGSYEKANVNGSSIMFSYMEAHRKFEAVEEFIKKSHRLEIETIGAWLKAAA